MILAQRFPIERVASGIVTLWGVCLLLTTACKNYQGLFAQRFFLGVLESGISPMFMLIVVRDNLAVFPFIKILRWKLIQYCLGELLQEE